MTTSFTTGSNQAVPLTPKEKQRNRWKRWAAKNRERLNANVRAYRRRRYEQEGFWRDNGPKASALKAWMLELKGNPCTDCKGYFPACCMDFDHRKGTAKLYNLGSMFAHHYSRGLIEIELAKCDLVCANCHRVRTRDRRIGSGGRITRIQSNGENPKTV